MAKQSDECYFANFKIDESTSIKALVRACCEFWENINMTEAILTDEYFNIIYIRDERMLNYFNKGYPKSNVDRVAILYLFENFNRYNIELPAISATLSYFNSLQNRDVQEVEKAPKEKKLFLRARRSNPGLIKYVRFT